MFSDLLGADLDLEADLLDNGADMQCAADVRQAELALQQAGLADDARVRSGTMGVACGSSTAMMRTPERRSMGAPVAGRLSRVCSWFGGFW